MALTKNVHCLVFFSVGDWVEALQPQYEYGLASVDGFCQGVGELDQLGDVASEILNIKYPGTGYNRVSKLEAMTKAMAKMLNVALSQVLKLF